MDPRFLPTDYFRILHKEEIFPDTDRPLEIDLGCGDGTFIAAMAAHHPERDFLGIERLMGRVTKTIRKIQRGNLDNARVLRLESAYSVGWLLPTAGVSRLHLLCPDPWPKKRHHKNRLINREEFLAGLERILAPDGEFLLKSDHEEYFENAVESFAARPTFVREPWPENAFSYPQTDFEMQWLAEGRSIHRGRWRRVEPAAVD
jgi:tRNA (guanine-N7-)-methyltransferase